MYNVPNFVPTKSDLLLLFGKKVELSNLVVMPPAQAAAAGVQLRYCDAKNFANFAILIVCWLVVTLVATHLESHK